MANANTWYRDNGTDLADLYVTRDYIMTWYPSLVPNMTFNDIVSGGLNNVGQLGDNTTNNAAGFGRRATELIANTSWKACSFGQYHSGYIRSDNVLWMAGEAGDGQLGTGARQDRSSPVTPAGGGLWQTISCSNTHNAAIRTDGSLWCWGLNAQGKLGDNTTTSRSSPVSVSAGGNQWKQADTGTTHTVAVKADGTLWTWGWNGLGQLGTGATTARSSPGTLAGGGTNWKQVSAGNNFTAAVKTDGTLWTWGVNNNGQLGDGSTTNRSSPVTTSGGGTTWNYVSAGNTHIAAIKTDGTLWTWGRNANGQLGDGTSINRSSPVTTIGGGTSWKQVSAASTYNGAIKTDGSLWFWGYEGLYSSVYTLPGTSSPVMYNRDTTPGTNVEDSQKVDRHWRYIECSDFNGVAIVEGGDF